MANPSPLPSPLPAPPPPRAASPEPAKPTNKPTEARKTAPAAPGPAAPHTATESPFNAAIGFLWRVFEAAVWMLVALVVLANLRRVLRFIDSLFETTPPEAPPQVATDNLQTEAVAASLALDLHDLVQSEFSAADIRKQTEILRALKDQLDAEVKAARATIRRERARAQQQRSRKDVA